MKQCKKCLLLESGEKVTYQEISDYLKTLDKNDLVSEAEYERRITDCIKCDNLISGMCLKCGCYVEVRARLKNQDCPDENFKRWKNGTV